MDMMKKDDDNLGRIGSIENGTINNINNLSSDAVDLIAMGYVPELRREFSWLALLGNSFSITNSWLGLSGGFTVGISIGGSAGVVYGIIICAFFSAFVAIALAELISAMPNAGGQYFWAMELAPKRYSRVSGYCTGLCNVVGTLFGATSSCITTAYQIWGCVLLYHPELTILPWHVCLLAMALSFAAFWGNTYVKFAPKFALLAFASSLVTWIVLTITIPASSPTHTNVDFIFNNTDNTSGWSSTAMAFFVSLLNANYAFAYLDAGTHLAEEVVNPAVNVPKAILGTVIIGFVTAFPLACLLMYSLVDYDTVVGTATGVPLLELMYQATGQSKAAAVVLQTMVIFCFFTCIIATHTLQARVVWTFSRDNGLLFSNILSKVHPKLLVPLNAHIFSVLCNCIMTLLLLISSTAFNSTVAAVVVLPYVSYLLPMGYSLWRKGDQKKGPFNLGFLGTVAKYITIFWCLFTLVIYSFPYQMPVTKDNMNYISVVYAFLIVFAILDWQFRAKKSFKGHSRRDD